MKLLWVTNFLFPEISEAIGIKHKYPNGWTYSAARLLQQDEKYEFAVAAIGPVKYLVKKELGDFVFYVLPATRKTGKAYDKYISGFFKEINEDFKPDVVHLYGTEYPHSYAYLLTNTSNVVISIQGLVGAYAKYYLGAIPFRDIFHNITFHDLVRKDMFQEQKAFENNGKKENICLQMVNYLEGRTSWDRAISTTINPDAHYFHCPRVLREEFYRSRKWEYDSCQKHTIFISQSHYPIKGGHKVFEALQLVKRKYPDSKIIVAGVGCTAHKTLYEKLRYTAYGKYLNKLIKKLNISDSIEYTGPLNAAGMCSQYLKANVYVCPSAIENSPNSVAEAQILGVPLVATYAGGTPDMVTHGVDGYLYRFEEVEMLADIICRIFEMGDCSELSMSEVASASVRHDRLTIIQTLKNIYNTVYQETHE